MSTTTPAIVELEEQTTAVIRGEVPMSELAPFFDRAFSTLPAALARQHVTPVGPPFARYAGPPTDVAVLEVGFPTATAIEPDGEVVPSSLPAGRVARTVHAGGYDGLGAAWASLAAWISERGHTPGTVLWETYLTQPTPEADPADARTELSWTVD